MIEARGGGVALSLAPAECVILRRETPKDPVTHYSAGSSATPSPKGCTLKNLNAENARFLLDHFVGVNKMIGFDIKFL